MLPGGCTDDGGRRPWASRRCGPGRDAPPIWAPGRCPSPKRAPVTAVLQPVTVRSRCPPPGAVSRYPTRGDGDLPRESRVTEKVLGGRSAMSLQVGSVQEGEPPRGPSQSEHRKTRREKGPDGSRCREHWRSRLTVLVGKAMEQRPRAAVGPKIPGSTKWKTQHRRGPVQTLHGALTSWTADPRVPGCDATRLVGLPSGRRRGDAPRTARGLARADPRSPCSGGGCGRGPRA